MLETGLNIIKNFIKTLPDKPGVYRMLGDSGDVLYVGKAKNLKKRVTSYTQVQKLPHRLQRMVAQTLSMEIVTTQNETEALLLESNLIKKLKPRYNILLRDDKSFPYIVIYNDHEFPRIAKYRGKRDEKNHYYGPFASGVSAHETLEVIYKIFKIRNCTDSFFAMRKRPCLQYHIKRCSAPCVGKISRQEYGQNIAHAQAFLEGKNTSLQEMLAVQMHAESLAQNYEKAAILRDQIQMLGKVQTKQRINISHLGNVDVIGLETIENKTCIQIFFYRDGHNFGTHSSFLDNTQDVDVAEQMATFLMQFYDILPPPPTLILSHIPQDKNLIIDSLKERFGYSIKIEIPKIGVKKQLVDYACTNAKDHLEQHFMKKESFKKTMEKIGVLFGMTDAPSRIEAYDNSHFQGSNPYGVMVVANQEGFDKRSYRKFAIKQAQTPNDFGGDDYAMMREVLERRFKRMHTDADNKGWVKPDLILIDGGKGQLKIAHEVLKSFDCDDIMLVAIAKGPHRNAGEETFFMIDGSHFSLPKTDPRLYFLQKIRDESHRFAIGSHRAGREKRLQKSALDSIPGIGPARKRALLQHFGSAAQVRSASLNDLAQVAGISKEIAKIIYNFFHNI